MSDKHRPHDWPSPSEFIEEARKHRVGLLGPQAQVGPYTAVTGFMSPQEVKAVAGDAYTISGFGTPLTGGRKLAIGVLASWKTLNGEAPGQPGRYPKIDDVRGIIEAAAADVVWSPTTTFRLKNRCLRMIHYNTREPNLLAQLDRLCELAGENLDGFQLNMIWPPEDEIRWLAQDYPTLRFILQVNQAMFKDVGQDPAALAREIGGKYVPWITDILFDMSGGTGKPADLVQAAEVLEALYDAFGGADAGGTGIGLAGGLDWHSVVDLQPLFERWPDLSIDAEGRLRGKDDALDCEMAREYVRRAAGVIPHRKTAP